MFADPNAPYDPWQMSSFGEVSTLARTPTRSHANIYTSIHVVHVGTRTHECTCTRTQIKCFKYLQEHATRWQKHNRCQLSRCFPKGTRVDSSNMHPHPFWDVGCR